MSTEGKGVKAIFQTALEKETPESRAACLDEACAGDPALRARVGVLLGLHDQLDRFFDQPAAPLPAGDTEVLEFLEPSMKSGSVGRLGHYEVLDVVGRGGMGV